MRKITTIKLLLLLSIGTIFLFSCGKTTPGYPTDPTPSNLQVLHVTPSDTLKLDSTCIDDCDGAEFIWSYVNDNGKTVHSYTLQIDAINGNFSNPYQQNVSNLVQNFTNGEFNTIALGLGLTPDVKGQLQARVVYLPASNVPQYSEVITFYVYPYTP